MGINLNMIMPLLPARARTWLMYRTELQRKRFWDYKGTRPLFEVYPEHVIYKQGEFMRKDFSEMGIKSALEIGCGYGRCLKMLSSLPIELAGVDIGKPQIDKAREFLVGTNTKL